MIQFGFVGSKANLSLFVHTDTSSIIYILIYVDDIIITGSNATVITNIIQRLHKEFAITDFGPLSFFLGIGVIRDATLLIFLQNKDSISLNADTLLIFLQNPKWMVPSRVPLKCPPLWH